MTLAILLKTPDPNDKRRHILKIIKSEKNGNYTKIDFSEIFGLDSFKAWLNEAEQISEKNQLSLRQSLVSDIETSVEDMFKRYFLSENGNFSDIVLSDSEASLSESVKEKTENQKIVQFPNFQIKLEDLTSVYWKDEPLTERECGVCGYVKPTVWEAVTTKDQVIAICDDCVQAYQKQREVNF